MPGRGSTAGRPNRTPCFNSAPVRKAIPYGIGGDLPLDPRLVRLFEEKNLVFIATIMKDGSPQLTPVWANLEDGYIMVNTAEGRIKYHNVRRDPRVAVSVVSNDDPLKMTTIRGRVQEIIPDYDYLHADKLTMKYMGRHKYPFKRAGERRVVLKIIPDRVFFMPRPPFNAELS